MIRRMTFLAISPTAVGGAWSVDQGASIDVNGVVTVATDNLRNGLVITATYTNSGGVANSAYQDTVANVPDQMALPTLTAHWAKFDQCGPCICAG